MGRPNGVLRCTDVRRTIRDCVLGTPLLEAGRDLGARGLGLHEGAGPELVLWEEGRIAGSRWSQGLRPMCMGTRTECL